MSNWITIQVEKGPKYVSSFLFKNEWKVSREGLLKMCPIQGESKTLIRLILQKSERSAGSMGQLARKGFSFF